MYYSIEEIKCGFKTTVFYDNEYLDEDTVIVHTWEEVVDFLYQYGFNNPKKPVVTERITAPLTYRPFECL